MKPFNIEKAKKGEKVCTRDGHDARILCFDRICTFDNCIIIALVYLSNADIKCEEVIKYDCNGHFYGKGDDRLDLMMAD